MNWRDDAACHADNDPKWLGNTLTMSIARTCWPCPVRVDCLFEALSMEPKCDPGIWGGTTEYQRHNIRKDRTALGKYWAELKEAAV